MKERQTLPKAREVKIKLSLPEAKKYLEYLPTDVETTRKIREAIERANFWNFLRTCRYLEAFPADFHLSGVMEPAWHLYCIHPENKKGKEKLSLWGASEESKNKITGSCGNRENCPIYAL